LSKEKIREQCCCITEKRRRVFGGRIQRPAGATYRAYKRKLSDETKDKVDSMIGMGTFKSRPGMDFIKQFMPYV
jgi:hypothetical protein